MQTNTTHTTVQLRSLWHRYGPAGLLVLGLALMFSACFIAEVNQPSTATAGEVITITVTVSETIEDVNAHVPVLSIMVPEDWSLVEATYSSDVGDGTLIEDAGWTDSTEAVRPASEGMKWIGMVADAAYAYPGVTEENPVFGDATLTLQVGETTGDFELGYFLTDNAFTVADILGFWQDGAADTLMGQPISVMSSTDVEEGELPVQVVLEQSFPNPFHTATTLRYAVEQAADMRLAVFDVLGREVAAFEEGLRAPGVYEVAFEAQNLPSGLYLYQLEADGEVIEVRSMVLAK